MSFKPMGGRVIYKGDDCTGRSARLNVRGGMALIPSERFVFPDLSVMDNLLLGATNAPQRERRGPRLELVFDLFPILRERSSQQACTMSGGQQRMVSLGIALMAHPQLLMLDEPSLGLAPLIIKQIFDAIRELNRSQGLTVFLVEQNAFGALKLAHRGYVLVNGSVTMSGSGTELLADPHVRAAYLEGGHH